MCMYFLWLKIVTIHVTKRLFSSVIFLFFLLLSSSEFDFFCPFFCSMNDKNIIINNNDYSGSNNSINNSIQQQQQQKKKSNKREKLKSHQIRIDYHFTVFRCVRTCSGLFAILVADSQTVALNGSKLKSRKLFSFSFSLSLAFPVVLRICVFLIVRIGVAYRFLT